MESFYTRFWSKVQKTATCWLWTGGKDRGGYGKTSVAHKSLRAHRVSWVLANGQIPKGRDVLHRCDNPPCVRPGHLFLGTDSDNMKDRAQKGRQPRGEKHSQAILTEADVVAIRTSSSSRSALATQYGVAYSTIRAVLERRSWRHL